ncbi:MAG TPA: FtsK/SpoIIIE domain-containing protein [Ktedonobacterales bacterium]
MQPSHPADARELHHRAPRLWPIIPDEPIIVPYVKPEASPQLSSLFVTGASVLGIGVATLFLRGSTGGMGGLGIGMLAVSGVTALVSGMVAVGQFMRSRSRNGRLLTKYTDELDRMDGSGAKEGFVRRALREEAEARRANDLPLVAGPSPVPAGYSLPRDVRESRIEQARAHPGTLWQRRPIDPDFLTVRVGLGRAQPRTQVRLSEQGAAVRLPDSSAGFARQQERATRLVSDAQTLTSVPALVPLRSHGSVAVIAHPTRQEMANPIVRALLAQVALLHSPYEAQITVISPHERAAEWNWVRPLDARVQRETSALIAYGAPGSEEQLERLQAALTRREQMVIERHGQSGQNDAPLPHLVIVVDSLLPYNGKQGTDLLGLAPVALALRRGAALGVTTVSTHHTVDMAPAQCSFVIDAIQGETRVLQPDTPQVTACESLDTLSERDCEQVTHQTSRYQPQRDGERELPTSVNLLTLFDQRALDPDKYEIEEVWRRSAARLDAPGGKATFAVPIGSTTATEPLALDFLKDGPHGLLIGKTGSGKSELLRSIIAGMAILYPPERVNFVLVDYKGGLGLDAYKDLPHTLAFLTNLQPGQASRFLKMLESEINTRQEQRRNNAPMSRLFVVIDEFAEMVSPNGENAANGEQVMAQMLKLLRLGRQLDVHLLFASQRPENAFSKLRGYVQYRIALRTNSDEDSKEIIGRPDAAQLPSAIPGRGYLLRGDYQLQEFQAALVSKPLDDRTPTGQQAPLDPSESQTVDQRIVARMAKLRQRSPNRWPEPLPTPGDDAPLVLYLHGGAANVSDAWGFGVDLPAHGPVRDSNRMIAPIGKFDRPKTRSQGWFPVDLLGHQGPMYGGPLLVMGEMNAGKTTTLQTLLLFFATQYAPDALRWYVIDPSRAFDEFRTMWHARDALEPGAMNIIDGSDEAEFEAWRKRLEAALARDAGPDRPPFLLLVDSFDEVAQRLSMKGRESLQGITQKVARNRQREAYLALSTTKAGSSDSVPGYLMNAMTNRIILQMANPGAMATQLGLTRLPIMLDPAPGRGFIQTRTNLDQIQIAAPVSANNAAETIKGIGELLDLTRWRVG